MATAKKTDTKVVPFPGDPEVTAELSRALGLSEAELARAMKELARSLTHAELGVLSIMWSERESQKTARAHTRRLPTTGPHVVQSGSNRAGAVDLGDGYCAVFALATGNSGDVAAAAPASFGNALREVVALGAAPSGLFDSVRLGAPTQPATAEGLRELASKLGAYARDAEVPVLGGDLQFDVRQGEAPQVQAVALGIARTETLLERSASGLGNTIVCAGLPFGGDAAHDAAAAGAAQRRLTEACLSAFRLGCVEGASAVAASGLAGALVHLAGEGETGIELDLDAVPRRTPLTPFQLLCASAGERMLLVVRKGREDSVLEVFRQHELEARVVGRVTNTGRLVCKASPEGESSRANDAKQVVAADLPIALLVQDAPSYDRPLKAVKAETTTPEIALKRNEDAESELVRLLGSVNVGSREWLIRRLETSAKSAPAAGVRPTQGDAAFVRLASTDDETTREKFVALSVDGNARYTELDPRHGAALAVAECARNVVCVGAEPLGLAHGLSLGDPEQPETVWRLSEMVDGMREACLALKLPVVAGNVDLTPKPAPSTPSVAVVGQLRDPADRLGMGFGRQADMVALLGAAGTGNLAGSEFLVSRTGELRGKPLSIDLGAEVKLQRAVLELARERLLSSAHDVSDGGLGVTLAECCIAGRIGCSVELPEAAGVTELHRLFHEEPSRVVVSFPPEQRAKVQERCEALGVPFALLGFVGGDTLEIEDVLEVPVQVLAESHARALARVVED